MALARETVRLGLGARGKAKIKVRQPLGEAVVVADGREREAIERLADVVREELNVRRRALRRGRRGAGPLRGQGQLPHAGTAVRQGHAAGGRRRSRRSTRPMWRPRCATAPAIGIAVAGPRAHALGRGPDPHDARARGLQRRARGRPRGRARPGDRRRAASARATRARSSTRSRTRARPPACRSRTASSWSSTATPRCSRPRTAHRDYIAGETLAARARRSATTAAEAADGHRADARVDGLTLTIGLRRSSASA